MDNELRDFMRESRDNNTEVQRALGRLEEGQKNQTSYIGAVSANVRGVVGDLRAHSNDDGAHGIKTTRYIVGLALSLMTVAVGGLEAWRLLKK